MTADCRIWYCKSQFPLKIVLQTSQTSLNLYKIVCVTYDLDQAVLPAAVFFLNESPGLVFWGRFFPCSLTLELRVKVCTV